MIEKIDNTDTTDSIYNLTLSIMELINKSHMRDELIKDKAVWNQICSSKDVIQDTELAIRNYQEEEFPREEGRKYLLVYGVLQSLFLQQDAAYNLACVLGLRPKKGKEENSIRDLKENLIRRVRNDYVGHPTERGRQGKRTFHYISRITICKEGFKGLTSYADNGKRDIFENIKFLELFSTQKDLIKDVLCKIRDHLEKKVQEHFMKFHKQKLIHIFNSSDYHLRALSEISTDTIKHPKCKVDLEIVFEKIHEFAKALEERYELDNLRCRFEELEKPLAALKNYLSPGIRSKHALWEVKVFVFYLQQKMNELKDCAKEIDEEYEKGAKQN